MKAIEVQLAVHRAPEMSRLQHEQMQRPLTDQVHLAEQANSELERARHRPAPTAEASEANVRKDGDEQGQQGFDRDSGSGTEEQEVQVRLTAAPHPFKGKHLDLSL